MAIKSQDAGNGMATPRSARYAGRVCRIRLRQGYGATGRDKLHLYGLPAGAEIKTLISVGRSPKLQPIFCEGLADQKTVACFRIGRGAGDALRMAALGDVAGGSVDGCEL